MTRAITSSFPTSFAAQVHARELARDIGKDSLTAAFASSTAKVFPYQIAAARFALHAQNQKGAVLCDEGSLGKTYEALLIAAQKWIEGHSQILIILPPNLLTQWKEKIEKDFTLPSVEWRSGPLPQEEALLLTTYESAIKNAEALSKIRWDLVVFDEADCLFKPSNKSVQTLKATFASCFKLLLTPTPITMSIMDIYGLLHFIDETILPPADEFYKRYFRKPENYPELTSFVAPYCFRTLKKQVAQYVGFSRRVPVTLDYALTPAECTLYQLVAQYLQRPTKEAYPRMEPYELNLLFYHTLASCPRAFAAMLDGAISRATENEKQELQTLQTAAHAIEVPAKFSVLAKTLQRVFKHLRTEKLPKKAVVFVNNTTTLKELAAYLAKHKFQLLAYKDEKSIQAFRTGAEEVLLTLDGAAKGLDMEFCPVVINYDLLYNAVEMEQRICRCHRQGQRSDVLVINLLSKENLADVRILELINKRTLQFDGIFGSSDDIVGTFAQEVSGSLPLVRPNAETAQEIQDTLQTHRAANEQLVTQAEDILFTTFSKEVADKVTLTPKYIQEKSAEINARLWALIKYFISHRPQPEYAINEEDQTLTLTAPQAPVLLYYWSGNQNRPYVGKQQYGAKKDFKPAFARITPTSILGREVLNEICCPDSGNLTVAHAPYDCKVGLFYVRVSQQGHLLGQEDILLGLTKDGKTLSHADCLPLFDLPVIANDATRDGCSYATRLSVWGRSTAPDLEAVLKKQVQARYSQPQLTEGAAAQAEQLKRKAEQNKTALEKSLYNLKGIVAELRQQVRACGNQREEMLLQKQLVVAKRDLLQAEEKYFFKRMEIEAKLEKDLAALQKSCADLRIEINPIFTININRQENYE